MVLRNVVPRQGTETTVLETIERHVFIEKCSSPTGDGNRQNFAAVFVIIELRNVVPRQGTETRFRGTYEWGGSKN